MRRLLPLVLLLTGCGKGSFNATKATGVKTLTYALTSGRIALDPGMVNDAPNAELIQNVADTLVSYDEQSRLVPLLAERWDVLNAGKTYVFHLRKGLTFSNGKPCVADDVRWTWERNLSPKYGSPQAPDFLGHVVGAPAYLEGKAKTIGGVKVVDALTLSVTLDSPRPQFLNSLTNVQTAPVSRDPARPPEAVSCVGPYRIDRFTPDAEVVLTAIPEYWQGPPKIGRIVRPIITDADARMNRYRSGELDYIELTRAAAVEASKDPKLKAALRQVDRTAVTWVELGERSFSGFRDPRVRRAFAMGFDRAKLVADVLPGYREAKGLVPPGVEGFPNPEVGLGYDPVAARKLLEGAGFPGGKGFPRVEFAYLDGAPEPRMIAELIAMDLRRNLGVLVRPRSMTMTALMESRNAGRVALCVMGWIGDPVPSDFLTTQLASDGPQNKSGFHDPTFDDLAHRADVELDHQVRLDLYRRAERRAVEEAPRIPICYSTLATLTAPRVKRFPLNEFGAMPVFLADVR